MPTEPSWRREQKAWRSGLRHIAGIDEAGRGPLAGPVVAAAVVFPPGFRMDGLADSKQLSPERRRELLGQIRANAAAVGVGVASAEEIDRLNVLAATHLAAWRAIEALAVPPDYLLTDYLRLDSESQINRGQSTIRNPQSAIRNEMVPVEPLIRGDQRCASVAAASIIAKVARDELMCAYDDEYPGYGFAAHKGYGTVSHLDALRTLGPTTIHRLTFRGVVWFDTPLRHSTTFNHLVEAIAAIDGEPAASAVRAAMDGALVRLPERERIEIEESYASRLTQIGCGVP